MESRTGEGIVVEPLAYASRPAWHRRRRFRRVLFIVICGVALLMGWRSREPVIGYARVMLWQHRCDAYALPPGTVAATVHGSPPVATAAPVPSVWMRYVGSSGRWERPWGQAIAMFSGPWTMAFIHGRRSPGGHERIVGLECDAKRLQSGRMLGAFEPLVVEPADWRRPRSRPVTYVGRLSWDGQPQLPPGATVQLFAGQPDPADESHFTMAFNVNGQPGTIDGWLGDDEDVRLAVRPNSR